MFQSFHPIRFLMLILEMTLLTQMGRGQIITENFNYTALQNLTNNGWSAATTGTGINPITVYTSGLTYAGSTVSGIGNAASMTTSGEDLSKTFSAVASGNLYASFLVNISAAQATGDYFFAFNAGTAASPTYASRVYVKSTPGGFYFGIAKINGTITYESGTPRTLNTTYQIVINYTFNSGTTSDDVVSLWVNPVLGTTEPAATISTSNGNDAPIGGIIGVALRQGIALNASTQIVDGILVDYTWALVTPVALSTPTLLAGVISSFGDVCINTSSSSNTFNLSGSNLNNSAVNVSASSVYTFSTSIAGVYSNPLVLNSYTGTSITIYVKFTPTSAISYNTPITIGGGGAVDITVSQSGNSGVNTAPGVTANAATGIISTGATISGTSTSGCSTVTAFGLVYNTTNGFTNNQGIAATTTGTFSNFSATLSGLSPNTIYYYKSFATNLGGTTYSDQSSFTTSVLAAPTAKTATDRSCSEFTANWGSVEGATEYRLDVSTSPTFDQVVYASDLIISEYVEGSSTNKYVEIYNGTGAAVDLTNYELRLFTNGAATSSTIATLSGILEYGQTIVYKNSSASIYSGAATVNTAVNFNGDDAIALYKVSTGSYIDIFGQIGTDPGTAWTSGSFSTLDKTLVRNADIISGITSNPTSDFPTLSTQWTQFSTDYASNLGSHTMNLGTTLVSGYSNLLISGTSQSIIGLSPNTTYYYRVRAISSDSTSVNSDVITASTYSSFNAGSISLTNQPICYGGDPSEIGSSVNATGGDNSITYSWRSSADNYTNAISGATLSTYTPPSGLTTTTTYRRFARDGTCNTSPITSSGEYTVTVNPYIWTGTTNSSWMEGSNWSCGIPPPAGVPVTIETASNLPVLSSDVVVGNLTFNSGKITLGNYNLTVNGTIAGQSSTSFFVTNGTGELKRSINATGSYDFPIGTNNYAPITFTLSTIGSSGIIGARTTTDNHPQSSAGFPLDYGRKVNRYWTIENNGLDVSSHPAQVDFNWDISELGSRIYPINISGLSIAQYGTSWSVSSSSNKTSTSISATNIQSFSDFVIALPIGAAVLPVSLLSFSGCKDGVHNQLSWVTATETNNKGFQVERSADGRNYQSIGFVNTQAIAGNSQAQLKYSFVDAYPTGIKQYYRLRQMDIDGRSNLSNILLLQEEIPTAFEIISVFPNPSKGLVTLMLSSPVNETVNIRVLDLSGRVIETRQINLLVGNNSILFDLSKQAKGQYLIAVGEKVVPVVSISTH